MRARGAYMGIGSSGLSRLPHSRKTGDMYERLLSSLPSVQQGKAILLWVLGVPIPILFVIFFLRGCT